MFDIDTLGEIAEALHPVRPSQPQVVTRDLDPRLLTFEAVDDMFADRTLAYPTVTMSRDNHRLSPNTFTWGQVPVWKWGTGTVSVP